MQPPRRRAHACFFAFSMSAGTLSLFGCASPGPPRPPSLGIPRLVSDLSATRSGGAVILQFTVPARTTEGLPLRAGSVSGNLCRQLGSDSACVPVPVSVPTDATETRVPFPVPTTAPAPPVVWTDPLPPALLAGSPRPLAYRIELRNAAGRSAGFSDPVYALAGAAPPPVRDLRAEPMRLGIALTWQPVADAGEVLLQRLEPVSPRAVDPKVGTVPESPPTGKRQAKSVRAILSHDKPAPDQSSTPGLTVLQAAPGNSNAVATIDADIREGVPYRYTAIRRVQVQVGGRSLELESAPSAPVSATWRDIYPPPTPSGLAALRYKIPVARPSPQNDAGVFAVDLVWQPVNDARLAGYLVYRQALNPPGKTSGPRSRLTAEPLVTPGFHDATAKASERYRYSVTAIDPKGNESGAVETEVDAAVP